MSSVYRNGYFDILRAVAIFLVIANHTSAVADYNVWTIVVSRLVKVAVPLFLAISGFFVSKKSIQGGRDYYLFLKKQLLRVYIPLLVFSVPFILGNGISARSIVGRTILSLLGRALYPYYFVFLISQLYILLPLFQSINTKKRLMVSCSISFVAIIIVTYLNGYKSADLPLYIYVGLFPVMNMFFAQGCYYGNLGRQIHIMPLLFLLPVTLIVSCIESWYWETYYTPCGLTLTTFLFIWPVIKLLFSERVETLCNKYNEWLLYKALAKIGRLSFTIFLLHAYIIQILSNKNLLSENWALNTFMVFIITTTIVLIAEKVLPKYFHRYIGL